MVINHFKVQFDKYFMSFKTWIHSNYECLTNSHITKAVEFEYQIYLNHDRLHSHQLPLKLEDHLISHFIKK